MQRIITTIMTLLIILVGTGMQSCKKTAYNFTDGYSNATADTSVITVDTSDSKPDYSMYSQARVFPGLVGDTVPRLQNYPVTINLNYLKNPSQLRISVLPKAWLSTGMYEPTGEPVAVDVPVGVYGLTAQIGCWTDDLNSIDASKRGRYPIVYTTKQLFPGRNYIRSPFGGPIYITTTFAQSMSVNLVFSGAVKMPNFVLNVSNDQTWIDSVKKINVPWVELIAPHIILTVNRSRLIRMPVTNATQLMQLWDDIIKIDYNEWEGLSENATDPIDQAAGLPWRCVADIQPVVGYAHNGYPVVYTDDDHWFKAFMTYSTIIQSGSWGIIHEIGHNNQQSNWSWSGLGETTNNLFSFKVGNRLGFNPQSTIWGPILAYAAKDDTTKDFIKDLSDASWAIPKCCFFVQLFDIYGYGLMTELYKQTRRAVYTSNNDVDRVDFTYEVASKYANVDLLKFFNQWGLHPSVQAKRAITALGLPALAKEIWLYNPGTKTGGTDPITVKYTGTAPNYTSTSNYATNNTATAYNIGATTEMTISFKLKINAFGSLNSGFLLKTASSANSNQGWWFCQNGATGTFRFVLKGASGSNYTALTTTVANVGEWHSITGKVYYSGTTRYMQIYLDGAAQGTPIAVTNLDCTTASPLTLGTAHSYGTSANEIITDVRIFNVALSDAAIAQYACSPTISSDNPYYANLIGYWPCTDGSGTTLKDYSSSGNNFTLQGTTPWITFSDNTGNVCL